MHLSFHVSTILRHQNKSPLFLFRQRLVHTQRSDNEFYFYWLYFYGKCCAMEANCDTMAIMAATLANGGICPITEEKVLKPDSVRDVLSLMHSCGMYDYSGQFAFKVS